MLYEQINTRTKRSLCQLNGTNVVLSDEQSGVAVFVEQVRECALVSNNARCFLDKRSLDHTILRNDSCQVHLSNYFDNSRTTHPSNRSVLHCFRKAWLVRPHVNTDCTKTRFKCYWIDTHFFNCTRSCALTATELCAFERWTRWRRSSKLSRCVTQHNFSVRSNIDKQLHA